MKNFARIKSILTANQLDSSITSFPTFKLSSLSLSTLPEFHLPCNLRLGHLIENIFSQCVKASSNYNLLHENVQIIENKHTIGEIDFILERKEDKKVLHVELAYKFYLYDPTISSKPIHNWIGPNRNDSLEKKLDKLQRKQFPLLHHPGSKLQFKEIETEKVSQALCLLVSLYVPFKHKINLDPIFEKAVKGYYLNFEEFMALNNSDKNYYLPPKQEWGIDPKENEIWTNYNDVQKQIKQALKGKKASLCWQKYKDDFQSFFIVWW